MKVVINKCYGGFSLSEKGISRYAEIKELKLYRWREKRQFFEQFWHYSTVPVETDGEGFISKMPETGYWSDRDIDRNDPALVQTVEELGKAADGECARLGIVEIPDGIEFSIEEYDGNEHVAEKHNTWS